MTFPTLKTILFLLPLLINALPAETPARPSTTAAADRSTFLSLLNAVPESSLHAALQEHAQPKYQDGIFEKDKAAVQNIHSDNPPLASKVVLAAQKLELLKRQNASTPATTPSPPPATDVPQSATIEVPVPVTLSGSSDNGAGGSPTPVVVTTPTAIQVPVTNIPIAITTTDNSGNTIVTSAAAPAVILSTTNAAGSPVVQTSRLTQPITRAPAPTPTKGQVITTTDAQGRTFVTTFTPGGGVATSLAVVTETLPNGDVVTRTETVISGAQGTGGAGGQGGQGASSTRGAPGLQTGAAVAVGRPGVEAAVAGAVVGILGLLV